MKRFFHSVLALALVAISASADLPFRQHRFDQFKALPLQDNTIVFFGNSITNMHEWWEAFGSEQKVVNRGNSGTNTMELIENIGSVIALQPAKVFIGIGTNDLGMKDYNQPDSVAARISEIVSLIRQGSPQTQIYVQSILPSTVGLRTLESIETTNALVKQLVEPQGAIYVDLYDDMPGILTKEISYDGLHITAKGYAIWLDKIAPLVGLNSVYTPDMVENNGGISNNSYGMRNTYFSAYPVKSSDILIIGDEMIHGGEWHELLANPNVKNRGTAWFYGGMTMQNWIDAVEPILGANGNKQAPEKILLYTGVAPVYAKDADHQTVIADYKTLIEKIRAYAPAEQTRIEIMSLIPRTDSALNDSVTVQFNNMLKALAQESDNVGYIDIYTPLTTDGTVTANPDYFMYEYLSGRGYGAVARAIAPYVPGSTAPSAESVEETYRKIAAATPQK